MVEVLEMIGCAIQTKWHLIRARKFVLVGLAAELNECISFAKNLFRSWKSFELFASKTSVPFFQQVSAKTVIHNTKAIRVQFEDTQR